eukprot:5881116-Pleurochrysis_carterae.AAC.3
MQRGPRKVEISTGLLVFNVVCNANSRGIQGRHRETFMTESVQSIRPVHICTSMRQLCCGIARNAASSAATILCDSSSSVSSRKLIILSAADLPSTRRTAR